MIWTLHIKLLSGLWAKTDWAATIALDASSTLEDLHFIIQEVVGFDNEHLYGFYVARTPRSRDRFRYQGRIDSGWYDEDDDEDEAGDDVGAEDDVWKAYDVWEADDLGDEDPAAWTTTLESLYPLPKDRRLFYRFDYGDDWIFQISRARNKPFAAEPGTEYPRLVDETGEKPEQYP
jgi:hypothetical protein